MEELGNELHNLYSPLLITVMIRWRRMSWAGIQHTRRTLKRLQNY